MKKNQWYYYFLIVSILLGSCSHRPSDSIQTDLQYYLDTMVQNDSTLYNAVILVQTPDKKYKVASGLADPANNVKMHVDNQFFGASTTKMLISSLVMMLEEKGMVKLEDPINKYLEDTLLAGLYDIDGKSYESEVKIKHLLNHTSGINSFWSEEFIQKMIDEPDRFWSPYDVIQIVKKSGPAHFKPGESWAYSDLGYILLGLIIENVTKDNIINVSRRMLFDPLEMNHTYWQFREKEKPSLPGRDPSHCFLGDFDYTLMRSLSADWAGGGMRTTCEDLNKFMQAFTQNKIFEKPETRDKMYDWIPLSEDGKLAYGFGVLFCECDENDHPTFSKKDVLIGHQGASGSFMYYLQNRKVTVIGTLNQNDESKISGVLLTVVSILDKYSS